MILLCVVKLTKIGVEFISFALKIETHMVLLDVNLGMFHLELR